MVTSRDDVSRYLKRLLREYVGKAYEAELGKALQPLADAFELWKRQQIPSSELSDRVHAFHQKDAREIWTRYQTTTHASTMGLLIAYAVKDGLLSESEFPPELTEYLKHSFAVAEELSR